MELHVKLIHLDTGLRAVIADNNGLYHENEMNWNTVHWEYVLKQEH